MNDDSQLDGDKRSSATGISNLAEEAFSRAAGAPLVKGNSVRLLKDAGENYPAWFDAIKRAEKYIFFESYTIYDDKIGNEFADALIAKAREGVRVRLVHDWFGWAGNDVFSGRFWKRISAGGVETRSYNPPHFDSPLGWVGRDHRKMVAVDGRIGFIAGLCVGDEWTGEAKHGKEPWRDTGVEIIGPAVADIEAAFADIWATMGDPIPVEELTPRDSIAEAGDYAVRVVPGVPSAAGLFRLDQLIAAVARKRLWLTDAYYSGLTSYVQALRAAAESGVDVRLLVPGKSDNPIMQPISRAGYRPLLEAGVRVFEWNGSMIHAKTAVADSRWARVGSSNLNVASWLGNYELDVAIEDERFAREMEEMYLADLENATEIVLDARRNVRAPGKRERKPEFRRKFGSGGRALAGALSIGSSVGAAVSNRRPLGSAEARVLLGIGAALLGLVVLMYFFPRVFLYPFTAFILWVAVALLIRGFKLNRRGKAHEKQMNPARISPGSEGESIVSGETKKEFPPLQREQMAARRNAAILPNDTPREENGRDLPLGKIFDQTSERIGEDKNYE